MNDTLKAAGRIVAELGAAKAESERLRKALKRIIDRCEAFVDDEAEMRTPSVEVLMGIAEDAIYTVHEADAALSQKAEPTDTFTAVDMATAAAQGFRDGQAAEPASAKDERHSGLLRRIDAAITAFTSGRASMHVPPEPTDVDFVLEECRKFVIAARPAQTEQQPVAYLDLGIGGYMDLGTDLTDEQLEGLPWGRHMLGIIGTYGADGYAPADPIAQTAPQPEQSGLVEALRTEALGLCDVVEKINSLSPVTYALQAGRAINKVRDAAAALSAQWTAEQ
jgi:hypothetical protein